MLLSILKRALAVTKRNFEVKDKNNLFLNDTTVWKERVYKYNEMPTNTQPLSLDQLSVRNLPDTPQFSNIPSLQHGLAQCLDGRIYNGDNGIGQIPINLPMSFVESISAYKTPSQDEQLLAITKQQKCKYISSTSNISSLLIHANYIFTSFRRPNFTNVLENSAQPKVHMISYRKPNTFILKKINSEQYSIQSDPGIFLPENQVLLKGGLVMEYLLTTPKDIAQIQLTSLKPQRKPQYYRYSVTNQNLLLRSQIDCKEKNSKTNQDFIFEIKTRAVCPIRYDIINYEKYLDYQIKEKKGLFESYQREYFDLIRGGFLKYAFQLLIGNMDGAFIAFHNTNKIYGFEYVPFEQIIFRLFRDEYNMKLNYLVGCKMITTILDVITSQFKNQDLKIGIYAANVRNTIVIFVEQLKQKKIYQKVSRQNTLDVNKYFQQFQLSNPVYKYQFSFSIYMNKILLRNSQIYFQPTDDISVRWKFEKIGRVLPSEYIIFLHDAYKLDNNFGSFKYNGSWPRTAQE